MRGEDPVAIGVGKVAGVVGSDTVSRREGSEWSKHGAAEAACD